MGWNDVRVSLVPRGRRLIAGADPSAATAQGRPILILHTEPIPDQIALVHDGRSCRAWLEAAGFGVTQDGPAGMILVRDEVEAFLTTDDADPTEVLLTFTLGRRSPDRVGVWADLVTGLCSAFSLALVDRGDQEVVRVCDFPALIQRQPNWADADVRWGWSAAMGHATARRGQ